MTRFELKRVLEELRDVKGRNTEMVSIYVPSGYNMQEIINMLAEEQSEAQNIKSKQTRKNVTAALEKIERRLKEDPHTPENGVALFAGNASEREGKPNYQLWEVVPPEPVTSRIYHCDKTFHLEPLEDMVIEKKRFGIIILDKNNAVIASLRGKHTTIHASMDSQVPGKTGQGGQSAQRFARIRKEMFERFMKDIAEKAKNAFFQAHREGNLQGIIVAGPGFAKEQFVDDGYLNQELQDKVIAQIGTNYANEGALSEVMDKAEELLEETAAAQERKLVNTFFEHLKKDDGLATYGLRPVAKAIQMGAVDTLLLSETLDMVEATVECSNCGHTQTEQVDANEVEQVTCDACSSSTAVVEEEDLIDLYGRKAQNIDSNVEIISTDTAEGKRLRELGGIAAILRYAIE